METAAKLIDPFLHAEQAQALGVRGIEARAIVFDRYDKLSTLPAHCHSGIARAGMPGDIMNRLLHEPVDASAKRIVE